MGVPSALFPLDMHPVVVLSALSRTWIFVCPFEKCVLRSVAHFKLDWCSCAADSLCRVWLLTRLRCMCSLVTDPVSDACVVWLLTRLRCVVCGAVPFCQLSLHCVGWFLCCAVEAFRLMISHCLFFIFLFFLCF